MSGLNFIKGDCRLTVVGNSGLSILFGLLGIIYLSLNASLIIIFTINASITFFDKNHNKLEKFHTLNQSRKISKYLKIAFFTGLFYLLSALLLYGLPDKHNIHDYGFILSVALIGAFFILQKTGFLRNHKTYYIALLSLWHIPFLLYFFWLMLPSIKSISWLMIEIYNKF